MYEKNNVKKIASQKKDLGNLQVLTKHGKVNGAKCTKKII